MRMLRRGKTRRIKVDIYKYDSNFALNAFAAAVFCFLYLVLGIRNGVILVFAVVVGWAAGYFVRRFLSR